MSHAFSVLLNYSYKSLLSKSIPFGIAFVAYKRPPWAPKGPKGPEGPLPPWIPLGSLGGSLGVGFGGWGPTQGVSIRMALAEHGATVQGT